MADTTYVDYVAPTVNAEWLNEINDHVWHNTPVSGTTVHAASSISNTPAGAIVATTVQAAIDELDSAKAPINSPTFTGTITVPQNYNASGASLKLQVGGVTKVTIGTQGIEAGSFKPGVIVANDLADGALIENSVNGIGYGAGSGGTVTQATSKSTTVTLNKPCGAITLSSANLPAGLAVGFTLRNSLLGAFDLLIINQVTDGTGAAYHVWVDSKGMGAAFIVIKNISTVALAEAPVINFAIIKGALA